MQMSKKGSSTIEGKKDEFTSYLESSGVVDNLTEVLISLYEESDKPKNPADYIKQYMRSSGDNEELNQMNKLKEENKKLKQRVAELERTIERMKKETS